MTKRFVVGVTSTDRDAQDLRPAFAYGKAEHVYVHETRTIQEKYASNDLHQAQEPVELAKDVNWDPALQVSDRHDLAGTVNSLAQISQDRLHALLIRYFTQELAPWFDICDPVRHFATVIPVRARHSRVIFNAICTASARHLVHVQKHRNAEGMLYWKGEFLTGLDIETAVKFQNECIRDLLQFSHNSTDALDEDLLAASIILRTDEEMDVPLQDGVNDRQVFLKVTSAIMKLEVPPPASPDAEISLASPDSADYHRVGLNLVGWGTIATSGLRQACFRVALRQELHASLMQVTDTYFLRSGTSIHGMLREQHMRNSLEYCFAILHQRICWDLAVDSGSKIWEVSFEKRPQNFAASH